VAFEFIGLLVHLTARLTAAFDFKNALETNKKKYCYLFEFARYMANLGAPLEGGSDASVGDLAKFGVVTVSDRASRGIYNDESGPAIIEFFQEAIKSRWQVVYRVIPDEQSLIEEILKQLCDEEGCCFVVTTGGTGPAPRDVTPEATEAVSLASDPLFACGICTVLLLLPNV